jgi:hypothetical protein
LSLCLILRTMSYMQSRRNTGTRVLKNITAFWDIKPRSLLKTGQSYRVSYNWVKNAWDFRFSPRQVRKLQSSESLAMCFRRNWSTIQKWRALMMEAVWNCEKSVNFYGTARRNIPEDSHHHTRCRENLKSHAALTSFIIKCEFMSTLRAVSPQFTWTGGPVFPTV